MFNHSYCAKCNGLLAKRAELLSGPQHLGLGRVTPEQAKATALLEQAYKCEEEAYQVYWTLIQAEEQRWEAKLLAEGYHQEWDPEERHNVWVKA